MPHPADGRVTREAAPPSRSRRALAHLVATVHLLLIPYTLLAWLVPDPSWLRFHLVFTPLMVLHWFLNRGVCVLSNLESWLRSGRWWDDEDPNQGGWVDSVARRALGRPLPPRLGLALPYVLVGLSLLLSLGHLLRLSG